jgi:hypothetical protein
MLLTIAPHIYKKKKKKKKKKFIPLSFRDAGGTKMSTTRSKRNFPGGGSQEKDCWQQLLPAVPPKRER